MLFRGDWKGQALALGLIPVRAAELQQSPAARADPICPLSPQGAAPDTPRAAVSEFIITFKKWKFIRGITTPIPDRTWKEGRPLLASSRWKGNVC